MVKKVASIKNVARLGQYFILKFKKEMTVIDAESARV